MSLSAEVSKQLIRVRHIYSSNKMSSRVYPKPSEGTLPRASNHRPLSSDPRLLTRIYRSRHQFAFTLSITTTRIQKTRDGNTDRHPDIQPKEPHRNGQTTSPWLADL
jgi:hypothetical protein